MRPTICLALVLFTLLGGCATLQSHLGAVPLIPREVLFGNPVKAAPRISPDGRLLGYLAPRNGVMNIWVRTLGREDDRPVTNDAHRGIYGFQWQFDSHHVLYQQDADGDENNRLYQTNTQTAKTRRLTPAKGIKSDLLALNWRMPEDALITQNARDPRYMDVYHLNLISGEISTDTLNPGNVVGWVVDQNMHVRAAMRTTPDGGTQIYLRPSPGEKFRLWQAAGPDDDIGICWFTPAGNTVVFRSNLGLDTARLLSIDLATSHSTVITANPKLDAGATLNEPRTQAPLAVQYFGARRVWTVLDPAYRMDFDFLQKVHAGDINFASQSLDNTRWIVQYVTDDGPQYYYLYDRSTHHATLLFADRPELEKYKLAHMQPIAIKARDGMELNGYLSLPPGTSNPPKTPLPLAMEVHGGPWARDVWGYNAGTQWLANRGYAVLKINFRGSTGFGKAYVNAGDREWGAKMLDDLLDGKQWAVAQGIVDPNKTAIIGGSYGGYATLSALAFTPGEFTCGISVVGPSNLITLLNTIPPYWEPEKAMFERRVGSLKDPEFLKSRSPLFKADQIRAPLLIAQGANDPRVKQAESDQIVKAIRDRGGDVEYMLFPDEGHGFLRPANRMKYTAAAEAFLARNLGGRLEPESTTNTLTRP